MKKYSFLYSMKTGLILLVVIAVLSVIGTLLPQEMPLHWYEHRYSPSVFNMIRIFALNDMYHSFWFSFLVGALVVNLFLCSVIRLPAIYKKATKPYQLGNYSFKTSLDIGNIRAGFEKLGFKKIQVDGNLLYVTRGKLGHLGSWVTHLALAVIVISYFLGRMYGFNAQVSGLPDETIEVSGKDFQVYIEDFLVDFRDDFSVNQYYSYIRILGDDEEIAGTVSVNNPLSYKDYNFYQIATGWAVRMNVVDSNELASVRPMYQQDVHFLDENTIVRVMDIRPDAINNSPLVENPIIIYQLIHNNRIESMYYTEPNQPIRWRGNTIMFGEPQRYTVLEVSNDPFIGGVWFGSVLLLFGLFLSFYVNPKTVAAKPLNTGEYIIYIHALKDKEELIEKIESVIEKGVNSDDRKSVV